MTSHYVYRYYDATGSHPATPLDGRLARGQSLTKFQRPRGGHWTETTFPRAAA